MTFVGVHCRAAGDCHHAHALGGQAGGEGVTGSPCLVCHIVELGLVGAAHQEPPVKPFVHELPGAVVVHDGDVANVEQVYVAAYISAHNILGVCDIGVEVTELIGRNHPYTTVPQTPRAAQARATRLRVEVRPM